MTTLDTCIRNTAEALDLSVADVREIAEQLKVQKAKLKVDSVDADLRKLAAEMGEQTRIQAALKRKQAALNVILRKEWDQDLERMIAAGLSPREAVLAKLVGSYADVQGARDSAAARRLSLEAAYMRDMGREIDPATLALLRDPKASKPLLDDVVREWRELKPDGKPGVTKNVEAKKLADTLAKYAEASRLEANRAGANIGRLDGWGGPQKHDARKVLKAGKDAWIKEMLSRLDLERSLGWAPDPAKALGDMWETIITGQPNAASAKEKGQRVGPANLARGLEKERVLHFKDADAWIAYNDRFGEGNVFTAMLDHQQKMARTVANMQTMGPNPELFLEAILETQRRKVKEGIDAQKIGPIRAATDKVRRISAEERRGLKAQKALDQLKADLSGGTGWIGKAYREISGATSMPHDVTLAKIGSNARAIQSMAKLGGAVFSSFSDLAVSAARLSLGGENLFVAQGRALKGLFTGKTKREGERLASVLGAGYDAGLGDIHSKFDAMDNAPGVMTDLQTSFFKYSGLTWWTNHLTSQFTTMISHDMALNARGDWNSLSKGAQLVLGIHNITAERWEHVRQMVDKGDDGREYVIPENARRVEGLDERARRELELDMRAYFADEATFGVLNGDDRTRMFVTQGTARGTGLGELFRFMMQFKSYPVAYAQKILFPTIRRGIKNRNPNALAMLIAMTTIYGFGSAAIKDISKNRTPKDPTDPKTWLAALVQGGGAGLYGDFLFGQRDRFGSGIGGDLLGPTIGTGIQGIELYQKVRDGDAKAGEAFGLLLQNTPFANLSYARAALDIAILNQFQEFLAPGKMARENKRIRKDFGQGRIVDQTLTSGFLDGR